MLGFPLYMKVTPEEVTEIPIIGPSFLVIDCPAKNYIPGVVKNETLKQFQVDERESAMVVHMAEEDIINDAVYKDWMSKYYFTIFYRFPNLVQGPRIDFKVRGQNCAIFSISRRRLHGGRRMEKFCFLILLSAGKCLSGCGFFYLLWCIRRCVIKIAKNFLLFGRKVG